MIPQAHPVERGGLFLYSERTQMNAAHEEIEPSNTDTEQTERPGPAPAFSAWPMWIVALSLCAVIASGLQIALAETHRGFFLITLCFGTVGVAAWLDAATRRIPNSLTDPAILLGLIVNLLLAPGLSELVSPNIATWFGATSIKDALLGFALCAAIGIVSFMAGGLGGGDTKLLGALGAMLGFAESVPVLFNALVFAALIGIVNWAVSGQLVARAQVVAMSLLANVLSKEEKPKAYPFSRSEAPFGVALLLGLILAQFVALHRLVLGILSGSV